MEFGAVPYGYGVYLDTTRPELTTILTTLGSVVRAHCDQAGGPPPPKFIAAPNRVDTVYDSGRDILYITSGNQVLRYQLAAILSSRPSSSAATSWGVDLSPDGIP